MAEGEDKEKVSVLMSLQKLFDVGEGIGYSGAELQTFVRYQTDNVKNDNRSGKRGEKMRNEKRGESKQNEKSGKRKQNERAGKRKPEKEEAAAKRDAQERKWRAGLNLRNEEVRLQH